MPEDVGPKYRSTIVGYYHDPPIWVAENPVDLDRRINFSLFNKEVMRRTLAEKIVLRVSVEGVFAFDFDAWPRGRKLAGEHDAPAPFEQSADAAVYRTYIANSFLAFFYTRLALGVNLELARMVVTPDLEIAIHGIDGEQGQGFGSTRVSHLALSRFERTYNPTTALRTRPSYDVRCNALDTIVLATILIRAGELGEGVRETRRALELVTKVGSQRVRDRLEPLERALAARRDSTCAELARAVRALRAPAAEV